jgi:hypothetical protein
MKPVYIFILLLFSQSIFAQTYDLKSADVYKNLEPKYEEWLLISGLGQYLKVTGSDTEDGKLSLYLGFRFLGNDSATVAWDSLKTNFIAINNFPIEEHLYRSMINIMKINPEYANLQIYSNDANGNVGCFYRGIYYDKAEKQIKWEEQNCMSSKPDNIVLELDEIKKGKLMKFVNKNETINNQLMQKAVYEKILAYSKEKYSKKISSPDDFTYDITNPNVLTFKVKELRSEVFADETNSFVAETVNWFGAITGFATTKEDWRTIEELHFTIRYLAASDNKSFTVDINIDGRYGSGFHEIKKWNQMYDMEKDFDYELLEYQNNFANKIYVQLQNLK